MCCWVCAAESVFFLALLVFIPDVYIFYSVAGSKVEFQNH